MNVVPVCDDTLLTRAHIPFAGQKVRIQLLSY